jgi:hypothetical protein
MNIERLNDLKAVLLEDHPEVIFDMQYWSETSNCGTALDYMWLCVILRSLSLERLSSLVKKQ